MIHEHSHDGMGYREILDPFVLKMVDYTLLDGHMNPCFQEVKWLLVRVVGPLTGSLRQLPCLVLHLRLVGGHNCVIFVAAQMDLVGIVVLDGRGMGCLSLGKDFVRSEPGLWAFLDVVEAKATFLC